ncbi:hypothetical protein [Streptomyces sp. KR55]|uniref:hypothetical protein n=1 Tax=Streptomyces sp. KR55 TaxID=3457425 RepID=UPI003FD662AC
MLEDLPSLPWPDFEPAPEPVKAWVQYEDGSLGSITLAGLELPVLARPGRVITQDEYHRLSAEMTDAHTARLKAMEDEEAARQVREFRDLTTADIPEETARRLSGYTGPADTSSTQTA